jgi:hypothetical protein
MVAGLSQKSPSTMMPGLAASKWAAEPSVPPTYHTTLPTNITLADIRLRLEALKVPIDGTSRPLLMARLQMAYLGWVNNYEQEAKMARFFRLQHKSDMIEECQKYGVPTVGTVPQMRRELVLNAKAMATTCVSALS